jgi:hypothetical protein
MGPASLGDFIRGLFRRWRNAHWISSPLLFLAKHISTFVLEFCSGEFCDFIRGLFRRWRNAHWISSPLLFLAKHISTFVSEFCSGEFFNLKRARRFYFFRVGCQFFSACPKKSFPTSGFFNKFSPVPSIAFSPRSSTYPRSEISSAATAFCSTIKIAVPASRIF